MGICPFFRSYLNQHIGLESGIFKRVAPGIANHPRIAYVIIEESMRMSMNP
jgi:hypothetical protein